MALPLTGQISFDQLNTELGRANGIAISLKDASTGVYASINQQSTYKPDGIAPHSMSEWRGYDHNAGGGGQPSNANYYIPTTNSILG